MTRSTLPSDMISSRGVKLDLVGQDVTIVYSFRALAAIEEHFDSISKALFAISTKDGQATATAQLLACGLAHEVDENGAPLGNVDNLWPLLDSMRVDDYHTAMIEALANAVPAIAEAAKADAEAEAAKTDPTQVKTSTATFPGESGTTSQLSSSDDETKSSGV